MLETSASELDRRERKKKKKNPDTGFAGECHDNFYRVLYEPLISQVQFSI